MTYQFKPVTKSYLIYNPLVLSSAGYTSGDSVSTDQSSQYPDTDTSLLLLADGKALPEIGKYFFTGDTDIFFYKEKELLTKLTDANGNPFIAYAKDKGEVGAYTGNFFALRGRLHSVEVLTTKPKEGGGYQQLKAWVGPHVTYQGGKAIEPYTPVWATADNGGQILAGTNEPAAGSPGTKSSNSNMLLIFGAFGLYLFTKRKKRK